ncbi:MULTISPECIES: 4-(cytidine 5'-diphospho)-2-C-methyl-D-erythritol kinase [Dyadobacter]|nr:MULTISPECIES: 4-(cytidine 5'-diphospho)-2-C-methyl-D-erythritol kinase [Dyadobacter]
MLVFPNAKINIGLNIVEKRPDGFHNIESCFYPVGWSDALEITLAEQFSFHSDGIAIPGNANDNLCAKAYEMLRTDFDLPAVKIHLLKTVPIGAGLGGGSADAAFTIKALNQLFDLGISIEEQEKYARLIGSDCAFFIRNKPVYCFEKGDQFDAIDIHISGKWIVLVNPGIHISTIEAYSGVVAKRSTENLRNILREPISAWKGRVTNDFEATLFKKYRSLEEIKEKLYGLGAEYAAMSGSGSTLFGIFGQEQNVKEHFPDFRLWQGFLK